MVSLVKEILKISSFFQISRLIDFRRRAPDFVSYEITLKWTNVTPH